MAAEHPDLADLIPSWELFMRARRLSPKTIELYNLGVRDFIAWCVRAGHRPALSKALLTTYLAEELDSDRIQASTVLSYMKGMKSFSKWAAAENEIVRDEIATVPTPKLDDVIRPAVTTEMQAALLATCNLRTMRGKRDDAILRMLRDTGGRARELTGIKLTEVNIRDQSVLLHGKGSKDRLVGYSDATAVSLDRWLRERKKSKYAAKSEFLWLSVSGPELSYFGLWRMVKRRAELAGIGQINPHMWRRMWAHECLDGDLSPSDLKSLAGWRSFAMVEHYTKEHSNARAVKHQKRVFDARDGS